MQPGPEILRLRDNATRNAGPINLSVQRGELAGPIGLRGAGHDAISRSLLGLQPHCGEGGAGGPEPDLSNPQQAMASGIGFLASDRVGESIAPGLSIRENSFLNPRATGRRLLSLMGAGRQAAMARRIGANHRAAELNGIPTRKFVFGAFVASGLLAALTGVLLAAKLRIRQASVGLEFMLPALVGAFLGSTTIKPGRVNVWGTIVGVSILAVGISGIQQFGGSFWVEPMFNGVTLLIVIAKADEIKATIKALGGTALEYVDTPIADTSTRMPTLTTALLQKYGASWTHALAINDICFDFMGPAQAAAGVPGDGASRAVAAGDGSQGACQRIRAGQYQALTVTEPLNLQGWQLVDEMNRAMQGEP